MYNNRPKIFIGKNNSWHHLIIGFWGGGRERRKIFLFSERMIYIFYTHQGEYESRSKTHTLCHLLSWALIALFGS